MSDKEKLTSGRTLPVESQEPGTSALILRTGDRGDIEYTEQFVRKQPVEDLLVVACSSDPSATIERAGTIDVTGRKLLVIDADADCERVPAGTTVERLSDPTDLSNTGIEISSSLNEDGGTVVCFHSLSVLLDSVETERLFRFLHVLTSRIRAADAIGHFYLDAAATDDQTIYMLRSAFDTVVETDTVSRFSR